MTAPPEVWPSDDAAFDALYPHLVRVLSSRFWTPVAVARRAARLLAEAGARRVLDVGAGAGKFALVGAAEVPHVRFVGIEQRAALVRIARETAARLRLTNVSFEHGDATRASWEGFDGVYFFNPFAENLFAPSDQMDSEVVLSRDKFFQDVIRVESALRAARVGTAFVTYHGVGGRVPSCYDVVHTERARSDCLRLWVKKRAHDDGHFYLELDGEVRRLPARFTRGPAS